MGGQATAAVRQSATGARRFAARTMLIARAVEIAEQQDFRRGHPQAIG